jgi:hypothetical protein
MHNAKRQPAARGRQNEHSNEGGSTMPQNENKGGSTSLDSDLSASGISDMPEHISDCCGADERLEWMLKHNPSDPGYPIQTRPGGEDD